MESLLEGISNADRMFYLQSRLDALPADLEALFNKLLEQMGPIYFQHACELFRLFRSHTSHSQSLPTLWELAYVDDNDTQSAIHADIVAAESGDQVEILEEMRRRLKSRCMGFLEVRYFDRFSFGELSDLDSRRMMKVSLLHRTARDYLYSKEIWSLIMDATKDASFNPDERWANGFLWCLKTAKVHYRDQECRQWFTWCLEYALRLEISDGKVRFTYLDEVGRAAKDRGFNIDHLGNFVFDMAREAPFPELAFGLGLRGYMRIKAKTTGKADVENLIARANRLTLPLDKVPDYFDGRQSLLEAIKKNDLPKFFQHEKKPAILKVFPNLRRELDIPDFV